MPLFSIGTVYAWSIAWQKLNFFPDDDLTDLSDSTFKAEYMYIYNALEVRQFKQSKATVPTVHIFFYTVGKSLMVTMCFEFKSPKYNITYKDN